MERLYAPWRLAYIKNEGDAPPPTPGSCIFCDKPAADRAHAAANYIVLRGETCFVILNAFPYSNGHVMVLPYRHIASPVELTEAEGAEMMHLCSLFCDVLGEVFRPHGYNVGINVGSAAGAGIAAHLHLHIVPRWNGDTNFMPVIGDVKVMPETLDQVYAKITAALGSRETEDGDGERGNG
jgi:ATP adenylyltransferase